DRAKLAALGVSDVCLSGTAWLLLFWKAAAAGWRSYSVSVGGDARLKEQPDMPVQETEFFLHVAFHRGLRRLGPAEPALARGAVASTPGSWLLAPRSSPPPAK